MSTKRGNLYLYLTLVCFVGIIAVFIVDGYLGVYDTVYVTAGEREQKIEPDYWLRGNYPWETSVDEGGKVSFRYELVNRQFSQYSANIEVTVWFEQTKLKDLISRQVVVDAFGKEELEWLVDTSELRPSGLSPGRSYPFSVVIKRGEIERRIIVYVSAMVVPPPPVKVVPGA